MNKNYFLQKWDKNVLKRTYYAFFHVQLSLVCNVAFWAWKSSVKLRSTRPLQRELFSISVSLFLNSLKHLHCSLEVSSRIEHNSFCMCFEFCVVLSGHFLWGASCTSTTSWCSCTAVALWCLTTSMKLFQFQ